MTELFGVSPQAVMALGLVLVIALSTLAAVDRARDPKAPLPIKLIFAGMPLLLGIVGGARVAAYLGWAL